MSNRILIASPTSQSKQYCDFDFIDNILLTNYPNFDFRLFDNTQDDGKYCKRLNEYYINKYGDNGRFQCIRTETAFCDGLISRITQGHNDCRNYVINNGYTHLWHVESDIFTEPHFLQELLFNNLPVVGALYATDHGRFRKLMVQQREYRSHSNVYMYNFDQTDDVNFIDGSLKQVDHMGLGCVLICRDILHKIPFRYIPNIHIHSDSFFAEDCHLKGIKIMANTALIAEHKNANWILDVL